MWQFLLDLTCNISGPYTVLVVENDSIAKSREYKVSPYALRRLFLAGGFGIFLVTAVLVGFTPLGNWLSGRDVEELRQKARVQAVRLNALQDSLQVQQQYAHRIGALLTGQVTLSPEKVSQLSGAGVQEEPDQLFQQTVSGAGQTSLYLGQGPDWPVQSPVKGFVARGVSVEDKHYAVDIAAEEGTQVRSVAAGYVVFADWTREGGHVIAVQHAGGYLSVYKHNSRLLHQIGDRIEDREPIAVSGNTGDVTTGPHLHFELWHNGLAQDPRQFIIDW